MFLAVRCVPVESHIAMRSVDSRILSEADRVKQKPEVPRMLAVDEEMVIPKDTTIRIIGTAADSMHGWTVWGFGVKKTVIPGRTNRSRACAYASLRTWS